MTGMTLKEETSFDRKSQAHDTLLKETLLTRQEPVFVDGAWWTTSNISGATPLHGTQDGSLSHSYCSFVRDLRSLRSREHVHCSSSFPDQGTQCQDGVAHSPALRYVAVPLMSWRSAIASIRRGRQLNGILSEVL